VAARHARLRGCPFELHRERVGRFRTGAPRLAQFHRRRLEHDAVVREVREERFAHAAREPHARKCELRVDERAERGLVGIVRTCGLRRHRKNDDGACNRYDRGAGANAAHLVRNAAHEELFIRLLARCWRGRSV
jgi:hypothetical protein